MRGPALALALLLAACGPHLAESVTCGDSGCPPPPGRPCENNLGCDPLEFCEKHGCAEERGRCAPRRGGVCSMLGVVCGCDRVEYPNDCARRAAGIAAFTPGPCQ